MDVETFLCQSRKKISFSKINLLNLRKNLVGPWGSTQLGERSPKPVSHLKLALIKVSHLTGPQNRPTCTCSTLPRASARTSPLAGRRLEGVQQGQSHSEVYGGSERLHHTKCWRAEQAWKKFERHPTSRSVREIAWRRHDGEPPTSPHFRFG